MQCIEEYDFVLRSVSLVLEATTRNLQGATRCFWSIFAPPSAKMRRIWAPKGPPEDPNSTFCERVLAQGWFLGLVQRTLASLGARFRASSVRIS